MISGSLLAVTESCATPAHGRNLLASRDFQCRVLGDDRGLQLTQLRAGVDAELVGEQRPGPLIGPEGFTLPAGPI